MKKKVLIGSLLFVNGICLAQWSSTSPGGTSQQYLNAYVTMGEHLIHKSSNAIINWGNGSANNDLYIRSLSTQGDINSYTDRIRVKYNGWTTFWGGVSPNHNSSNPSDQIHVFPSSGANGITITQASATNRSAISLENTSSAKKYILGTTGSSDGSGSGAFIIKDAVAGERLNILSNGNVGINNANPLHKLSVSGNIALNYALVSRTPNLGLFWGDGTTGDLTFNTVQSLETLPSASTRMIIKQNGNVGINCEPSAKLTVNGNVLIGDPSVVTSLPANYKLFVQTGILTERVRVAVNGSGQWADYVFANDYKLNKLSDVEAYINKNKHLPDVPSAEEVVKQGVDLGQMDALLLKKIEELTLYVIEQDKRIKQLENNK
jgi:hypothetical protein